MYGFEEALGGHEVLLKHKELLKSLSDDRVLCVCHNPKNNSLYLLECCDEWFSHDLTKEDCLELSEFFKELAACL